MVASSTLEARMLPPLSSRCDHSYLALSMPHSQLWEQTACVMSNVPSENPWSTTQMSHQPGVPVKYYQAVRACSNAATAFTIMETLKNPSTTTSSSKTTRGEMEKLGNRPRFCKKFITKSKTPQIQNIKQVDKVRTIVQNKRNERH